MRAKAESTVGNADKRHLQAIRDALDFLARPTHDPIARVIRPKRNLLCVICVIGLLRG